MTGELGQMYRWTSVRRQCVDFCTSVHEVDDARKAAIFCSHVKRRLRFRQLIWIGSIIEQQLHDVSVPTLIGGVERRSLPTDGQVHVRPAIDQKFRYFDISAFASDIESSNTINFVDSGAFVQGRRYSN
ncbi:hypothetical protein A9174_34940 (plasmid) [Mesorhizobium loti NZP2037]|nr:hypothetical protein A9174_34940 [Mesorhizobium loti NZP2037]